MEINLELFGYGNEALIIWIAIKSSDKECNVFEECALGLSKLFCDVLIFPVKLNLFRIVFMTEKLPNDAPLTGSALSFEKATLALTDKSITSAKKVTLVRHGLSTWNLESRVQVYLPCVCFSELTFFHLGWDMRLIIYYAFLKYSIFSFICEY